jgi:hypothetical protein
MLLKDSACVADNNTREVWPDDEIHIGTYHIKEWNFIHTNSKNVMQASKKLCPTCINLFT